MAGSPVRVAHIEPFGVRFDECGADGTLRTSAYVRYMQDAASVHSLNAGYTREWYREHGIFWLVRHLDLRIGAPSTTGDVLAVSTEVVGFRRIRARRRSEFRGPDGILRAVADVDWVLTSARGRPTRVPDEIVRRFPAFSAGHEPASLGPVDPPADAREFHRRAEPHELDPMAHVNNAAFIDQLEAALADAAMAAGGASGGAEAGARPADLARAVPRRYRLEYLSPAAPGSELVWRLWPVEEGWAATAATSAGRELLRALVTTG